MHQRKRLLRANRRPLDSFDDGARTSDLGHNVLSLIKNQNLFLKLVGLSLDMAREAGIDQASLLDLEQKLLKSKGL